MASTIKEKLLQNSVSKRQKGLIEFIREHLIKLLELDKTEIISNDQSILELGADSAQAIEFKLILEGELGLELKTSLIFDYPRLDLLADFLLSELGIDSEKKEDDEKERLKNPKERSEEIAIISMACRMPGGVMNPNDFWELLVNNRSAIEKIPKSRFDIDHFYSGKNEPGKISSPYGGFIKHLKEFDPQFFGISTKEATEMDPQQRVLMEVAWEAIENSGRSAESLKGENVGVFIGIRSTEYYPPERNRDPKDINFFSGMGTQLSAASGRLSYSLGLTGPSLSLDTACSASMTALHYACESIRNNESDGALVGGVNIIISGVNNVAASQGNMLSSDGLCKSFSSKADGYVRSEGCAVFYLKPLKKALEDRDPILSVISATGINQDGASGGLTVPYGPAQEKLINKTLDKANLKPSDIDYVEAHGTGTPLGDPIEVQALNNTIGIGHTNENPLKIGSVKSNIGHTEPVAGLAGLMKAVLSLQHEMIPSNLHADPPNPYIDWDTMPVQVVKENTPWHRNEKSRYAGISSFGFTGTNTHAIIKEAPLLEQLEDRTSNENHLFTCSAKTQKALQGQVQNYLEFFDKTEDKNLKDICYTALIGRNHFRYRLSVIGKSKKEIINGLENSFKEKSNAYFKKVDIENPKIGFVIPNLLDFDFDAALFLFNEYASFRKVIEDCDQVTENKYKIFNLLKDQNNPISSGKEENLILHFTCAYAYAKSWVNWGVTPDFIHVDNTIVAALLGACISGVFDFKSAIQLLNYQNFDEKELINNLEKIDFKVPEIVLINNMSGNIDFKDITTPAYWKKQLVTDSSEAEAVATIKFEECDFYICIDSLQNSSDTIKNALTEKMVLDGIHNSNNYKNQLLESIQKVYHSGADFDWLSFTEEKLYDKVVLPNYPFQRKHYWLDTIEKKVLNSFLIPRGSSENQHPLLGNKIELALQIDQTIRYNGVLNTQYPSFIKDHKVYDKILFPGAGYLEMVFSGAAVLAKRKNIKNITLSEISFKESLELKEGENTTVQTSFSPSMSGVNTRYEFNIHSLTEDQGKEKSKDKASWIYHVNGILKLDNSSDFVNSIDDIEIIKTRCTSSLSGKEHYQNMNKVGLHYGDSFQGVREIWHNENEILAKIVLPEVNSPASEYNFHPALLDSCFQSLSALMSSEEKQQEEAMLPISIQSITIFDAPSSELLCYTTTPKRLGDTYYQADFNIVDNKGKNIAFINGLKLIRLKNSQIKGSSEKSVTIPEESNVANENLLYDVSWITQPEKTPFLKDKERLIEDPTSWLVLTDKNGIGFHFSNILESKQERVVELNIEDIDFQNVEDWKEFLDEEFDESLPKLKGVINLWGIEQSFEQQGLHGSLMFIQALEEMYSKVWEKTSDRPRLWWVTKGGQVVNDDTGMIKPNQSTLWGFRSSLAQEFTKYNASCIDLSPSETSNDEEAQQLFDEIWNPGPEDQIAYRNKVRYVSRLAEYQLSDMTIKTSPSQLRIKEYGTLQNLEQVPQSKETPKEDEVQIAVAASALNFKDVLHTLGLLQEYSEQQGVTDSKDQPLGFECSGVVTAIGEKVKNIKIGDKIIATSPDGCMKSFINAPSDYVVKKPNTLNMIEAASIPTVFMTALYGLERLAKIKKGDKVLIHACAGGVGQAALQIAQNAGAVIFATASKKKWDFLKSKGVNHVMDSRSLDYADEINKITNGEGVDIVLNSLKDEYIPKNLEGLSKNGRYVEIGKIGIWSKEQMKAARPDVSYFVFDLGDDISNNKVLYKELLLEITKRFEKQELKSIPITSFDIAEAISAFQYLAQAKNIGKVVLSLPEINEKQSSVVSETKNYLITGGMGSLGLKVAEKLVGLGAKYIALTGRNLPSKDATKKIEELKQKYQINVQIIQSDISIEKDAINLFKTLNSNEVSLGGIVHAAGVLKDGIVLQQNWSNFENVMSSKMKGTWNLHTHSQQSNLDFFICFSSMTSVLGGLGQTNYAAANAYIDVFAHYRKDLGLPCLSINWGPWSEGGMASNMSKKDQQRIKDLGIESLSDANALHIFSELLHTTSKSQIGVWEMNWTNYFQNQQGKKVVRFLENFEKIGETVMNQNYPLLSMLKEKPVQERLGAFLLYLQEEVTLLMGFDSIDEVDPKQQLLDLGVDSLVAIDLSNRIQKSVNLELDISMFFEYPTLDELSTYILNDILNLGEEVELSMT